jgi:hypothetical protein
MHGYLSAPGHGIHCHSIVIELDERTGLMKQAVLYARVSSKDQEKEGSFNRNPISTGSRGGVSLNLPSKDEGNLLVKE